MKAILMWDWTHICKRKVVFVILAIFYALRLKQFLSDSVVAVAIAFSTQYIITNEIMIMAYRSKSEKYINALPIQRSTIVLSKYMYPVMVSGFMALLLIITGIIMQISWIGTLIDIAIDCGLILIVSGLGMCIEFSVNTGKQTHFWYFSLFLASYTALVVGSVMLEDFLMYYAPDETVVGISIAVLAGSLLLYAAFLAISAYRFQRMDV